MAHKPSIPKGTRDFNPVEASRRNYIFDTIRTVFKEFGYAPIETPAMENLSTLLGKYGEEGDRLLFKILNSGDSFVPLAGQVDPDPANIDSNALSLKICEKGLRYDLTVPFARFVVQHQNELTFPFKRYQIQPVWRADRPQKGRYREFFQCDADVIGSDSLYNEFDMVQLVEAVFNRFDIRVLLKINNRKVLAGIAQVMGYPDRLTDITVAMDKFDKTGLEGVKQELLEKGITPEGLSCLEPLLLFKGITTSKIAFLTRLFEDGASEIGMKGVEEIKWLFSMIECVGVGQSVELDLSLARGLNYYTGAIFEVKALDFSIGSICGGGRYDDLTGIFGLKNMSGVGISFGADRIYDVLLGLDKFPEKVMNAPRIVFFNMGREEAAYALGCMKLLRASGVSCELYPEEVKLKKQFDYAARRGIQKAVIIGKQEMKNNQVTWKNLLTGDQQTVELQDFLNMFGVSA
ncbi:MAG: histidine--tRNA ligase [Bacteroidales bacterium]|jgi:histidyl-tRNA synthetase|nr:histidine--tRNA ligase [Bacteroidales bacterium]MDD2264776.1 histidine--tRNA ligase [Bacteroidales bacterium]MDD2831874.1 histidine--tRNA ligase [Bacteroidales bacterium]MDD3209127.1 histidine--tRNA ligase [Bacteroidales bacterium]MDD3697997.1 histidine--tRNA ligase [Bacteroidales bacterium]